MRQKAGLTLELIDGLPTAAELSAPVFWTKLAPSIRTKKLAGVEPVMGSSPRADRRQRARKLVVVRASRVPKCVAFRDAVESEHFFDSAVAVGADDQNTQPVQLEDHVMVELPLFPVSEEFKPAMSFFDAIEQRSEHKSISQLFHVERCHGVASNGSEVDCVGE